MSNQVTLYRDASYGALAIYPGTASGTLMTQDFGLAESDFDAVLAVLESRADGVPDDGVCCWRLKAHMTEVMASIGGVMRRLGYSDDPLDAKVKMAIPLTESLSLDLPAESPMLIRCEAVQVGLLAMAALVERAAGLPDSKLSCNFYPRPVSDVFGDPLPFLRVQVEGAGQDPSAVVQGVRQALSHAEGLIRVSGAHAGERRVVIEAGFALPADVLEGYERRELPTFRPVGHGMVREVSFSLPKPLPEAVASDIQSRALQCGAVLDVEVTERVFRAKVPCLELVNAAFSDRIRWLHEQVQPWGAKLEEISREAREVVGVD